MRNMVWALLLVGFNIAVAELKVQGGTKVAYDRTPKLYITGTGFDADDHDITLELSATDEAPLRSGKDFTISKNEKGLILKLLSSRRFVKSLLHTVFHNYIPECYACEDCYREKLSNSNKIIITDGLVLLTEFRRFS